MTSRPLSRLCAACFCALLLAACSTKDAAYFEQRGDEAFKAGRFSDAAIQYLNALNKEPQRGDIRYKLADSWFAEGNRGAAYPEYIRAADLLPDNLDVQNRAGFLLVRGGLFKEAKDRARLVLTKDANNQEALLVLGNALAGLNSFGEAEDVLKRAVQIDPERAGLYTNVAVMQLAQGEVGEAEATFKQAVAASKGSAESHVALGNFYRVAGRPSDAEAAFRHALEVAPNNVVVHQMLATFYVEQSRMAEGEEHLKTVMSITKDPSATYALADFYVSAGRRDEALELLSRVAAEKDQLAPAKVRIALIHFLGADRRAAHAEVDEVLKVHPGSPSALTLKARLVLADGASANALDIAKQAVAADGRSAQAHLTMARVLLALNRLDDAIKELRDTLNIDPASLPAQLELAEFHRRRGELNPALEYANQAVKTHPGNLRARLARAEILLQRRDDSKTALAEITRLVNEYPTSTPVQTLLGRYYLEVGDKTAARTVFERSLKLAETNEALTGLVTVDLASNNLQSARVRVDAALARSPDDPGTLLLAAKVYGLQGQTKKAEDTLLKVVTLAPDNPAPYALLGQLYLAQGRGPEAKSFFANLVKADPRAVGGHVMLGVLHYASGDRDAARVAWETALRINERTASAANNLAWLYVESGTDLDTAQQLAQSARNLMPDQPEINDTLGWVYYRKKQHTDAIQYLGRAVQHGADNPTFHFHLGMAYAQAGEDGRARTSLTKALELDPKFSEAEQARATLARLVY